MRSAKTWAIIVNAPLESFSPSDISGNQSPRRKAKNRVTTPRHLYASQKNLALCQSALFKGAKGHTATLAAKLYYNLGILQKEIISALLDISVSSIDRILKPTREK